MPVDPAILLRLVLTPGLGPVRARGVLERFGPEQIVRGLSASQLEQVRGIGDGRSSDIAASLRSVGPLVEAELARADARGIRLIGFDSPNFPPLLAEIPSAPLLLYVRGTLQPAPDRPAAGLAIVGSRRATAYGIEQSERFSQLLAEAGLTIVSGGARGIDTAAHRAALRAKGHTIVVKGCGLGHSYPPENQDLFDQIVDAGGAIVSELPIEVAPSSENFPARNRIISGLSLGVLVVEAPLGSGALITARYAVEDHGREVMAIPGRIDSRASAGANELIKSGGAALVTNPADVIEYLESQARHVHDGTHHARYASPETASPGAPSPLDTLSDQQREIVGALSRSASLEELTRALNRPASEIQADLTVLEIRRIVIRQGSRLALRRA